MLEWLTGAKESRYKRLGLTEPKSEISPVLKVIAGLVLAIAAGLGIGYLLG